MIIWENIKFALSSIGANKMRSFLTMLGVIIGVFAVITLMGIGQGLKGEFTDQIENLGSNLIIVMSGNMDINSGNFNPAQTVGASTLKIDDAYAIEENIEEVAGAAPLVLISGIIQVGDINNTSTMTMGTTPNYFEGVNVELNKGRLLSGEDEVKKNNVVVIGGITAEKLFPNLDPIGQIIKFRDKEFTVIGTLAKSDNPLETSSQGGMSLEDVLLMPISVAQEITQTDTAFRIGVKARSPEDINIAQEKIKQLLIARHGEEDFTLLTQEQIIKMFSSFFDILNNTVSGIAAISLLVGGIGIMNIMLVSVTERTKEIGIRKAVGATNFNILLQFLVESSFISLIGGGIGVILSYAVTQFLTSRFQLPAEITPFILMLALGISVGVGVIFGLLPATKAARKNPIDALRYE